MKTPLLQREEFSDDELIMLQLDAAECRAQVKAACAEATLMLALGPAPRRRRKQPFWCRVADAARGISKAERVDGRGISEGREIN